MEGAGPGHGWSAFWCRFVGTDLASPLTGMRCSRFQITRTLDFKIAQLQFPALPFNVFYVCVCVCCRFFSSPPFSRPAGIMMADV